METMISTRYDYMYTKSELEEKIKKTIEKIVDISNKMDYRIENEIKDFNFTGFGNISKKKMKKINKYSYCVTNRPTLRNMNLFLHTICKINEMPKMRIDVSLKEQKIKEARKKYRESLKQTELLRKTYKDEKGGFYIVKNQKLSTIF